ncbi:hypothetical protein BYT27DRAFT_6516942 [Phlegmacium glaucopus]|nr:hypothetical protein BYT27DRAFT_6516942 [Phlegmacium glaucopus]
MRKWELCRINNICAEALRSLLQRTSHWDILLAVAKPQIIRLVGTLHLDQPRKMSCLVLVVILPKFDLLALILLPTTSPLKVGLNPKTFEDLESDSDKSLNYGILASPAGSSLDNETFDIQIDTIIDGESVRSALCCQLYYIKPFSLGHSTTTITTTVLDLSFRRASLGRQTKLTKPTNLF